MRTMTVRGGMKQLRTKGVSALAALLMVAGPIFFANPVSAATLDVCPSGCTYNSIGAAVAAASSGDTITVAAGTYNESSINLDKTGLNLSAMPGAVLNVPTAADVNGFDINADNVTVSGFDIEGPATSSYTTYAWGSDSTRGIAVHNGYTGFNITGNTIENLRNDVLIDGRNTGSVTHNVIDNSKSGISVQYTDGSGITITGNTQGTYGNDWGLNLHLNGHFDGATYYSNSQKIAADAPTAAQQVIIDDSTANADWTVQDQGYSTSNRTAVNVAATGSATGQGDPLGPLNSIQAGLDAIVPGGTVNVANGAYNENLLVKKDGTRLIGASTSGVVVNNVGANIEGYAISFTGLDNVSIQNMTFDVNGATSTAGFGFHAYQAPGLTLSGLAFNGPGTTGTNANHSKVGGVDINSSSNVSISNVSAENFSKNGFSFTAQYVAGDTASSNIALSDIAATGDGWAGLAFYTMNGANSVGHNITGVTFAGHNSLKNDGQGLFIEGDSDANFGALATPSYIVSGAGGGLLDLGKTSFSGNTADIVNYQTAKVKAFDAKFNGKTGGNMTHAERHAENALITDHRDSHNLGKVRYYHRNGGSGGGTGAGTGTGGAGTGSTGSGTTGSTGTGSTGSGVVTTVSGTSGAASHGSTFALALNNLGTGSAGAANTAGVLGSQSSSGTSSASTGKNANTKNTDEKSCSKILGICWYYWIPIVLVVAYIIYRYIRSSGVKQTNSGR